MICVAVTFVIKPGHEDEAITLFAKLTEHTRRRAGLPDVPGAPVDDRSLDGFSSTSNTTTRPRSMPIGPRPISSSTPREACFPSSRAARRNSTSP